MKCLLKMISFSALAIGLSSCVGDGLNPKSTAQEIIPLPQYTVTASGDTNETIAPSAAVQAITSGSTASLTVTASSGFVNSSTVTGTCPSGSWSGSTYKTGQITGNCTVIFSSAVARVVTPSASGGQTFIPATAQSVATGSTLSFAVTAGSGFSNSQNVTGTCPAGTWTGNIYTTGTITSNCTVGFVELSGFTLSFVPTTSELDMSNIYNFIGIANNGSTFSSSQGFDHGGNSYSSTCLTTPSLIYSGSVHFSIGGAGVNDVFNNSDGVILNVPSGNFTTLWVLAAGVNGNQTSQPFVFNYTTGSSVVVDQSLSDWGTGTQGYSNENVAITCTYRDTSGGGSDTSHDFWAYAYPFPLDTSRTLQSIQTPANVNVQIIAMSLD